MMNKIYVHVGLPKTATSTLQTEVFPVLEGKDFIYLGVDGLRRPGESSPTYVKFMEAVNNGNGISQLRDALHLLLQKTNLLLSDELMVVSSITTSWQQKLARVGEVLAGFDYQIIVSVREPVAAMFSYYVELYPRFSKYEFPQCALSHNDMYIYHYDKLLMELEKNFDSDRLVFIRFEDVIENNIDALLNILVGSRRDFKISYGNHNGREKKGGRVISQNSVTPYALLLEFYRDKKIKDIKIIHWLATRLKKFLLVIDKVKLKNVAIDQPAAEEVIYIKTRISNESTALSSRFGIKYD